MNAKQLKLKSETSGFENIGKFYKHIRKKEYNHIKNTHKMVYLLMVEYSFGYTNNIQYEITLSMLKIVEELGMNRATVSSALKSLQDNNLIRRIKWQIVGPKQSYKYAVIFPKDFHITTTVTGSKEFSKEIDKEKAFNKSKQKTTDLLMKG
jgi:predicted transcriptional regulator